MKPTEASTFAIHMITEKYGGHFKQELTRDLKIFCRTVNKETRLSIKKGLDRIFETSMKLYSNGFNKD